MEKNDEEWKKMKRNGKKRKNGKNDEEWKKLRRNGKN